MVNTGLVKHDFQISMVKFFFEIDCLPHTSTTHAEPTTTYKPEDKNFLQYIQRDRFVS